MTSLDETTRRRALDLAIDVAQRAGALLLEGQRTGLVASQKGAVEVVTEYDHRAEQLITEAISEAFTDHVVIGEEASADRGPQKRDARPRWYVDPIDGTTNYAHGVPWYAVSLALEVGELIEVGVIHAPATSWTFHAERGGGAWLGDKSLSVSRTDRLERALVATGFPYDRSDLHNVDRLRQALSVTRGVRRMGTASLDCAMVAAGWIDGYWEYAIKPWDVAAGALLVSEAGGRVTAIDDGAGADRDQRGAFDARAGQILATNGEIHHALQRAVQI